MMEEPTNDIRERLQEVARTIEIMLPPHTGFILLAYGTGRDYRLEYVSSSNDRDGCLAVMQEFIDEAKKGGWGKHEK
jgi:hypothetical protein